LGIIDLGQLVRFLIYNQDIINRYTIISLYNKSIYGKHIDGSLILYLIRITLDLFIHIIKINNDIKSNKHLLKLISILQNYDYDDKYKFEKEVLQLKFLNLPGLNRLFDLSEKKENTPYEGLGGNIDNNSDLYYDKYMKYKMKYIELKNYNIIRR
jgi:hypothetical protein